MIEIVEMSDAEIGEKLSQVNYGHLACCREDRPYVVPVHFVHDAGVIFIYTTEGKKFEIIKANPNVCLQAEEVVDNQNWQSVIVNGVAAQVPHGPEHERALELILSVNPSLTPAVSIHWMDEWVRENIEVIYRIVPTSVTGRRSIARTGRMPFIQPRQSVKNTVL